MKTFTFPTSLVPIQASQSNKRPLFFVHPASGDVVCYTDLVRRLGSDQPFYGLQARGLDGKQPLYTQVKPMASYYIELLHTVQPNGPYLLGGWSMGGIVAFEMAQQLQAQDQRVALLALLDTPAPTNEPGPELDDVVVLASFALSLGLPPHQILTSLDHLRQLQPDERLAQVLAQVKQADLAPADVELPQVIYLFHVFMTNVQAMLNYTPHAYSGPITLFKASEQLEEPVAQDLGWGALAVGSLIVQEIPGDHFTIVREPNVQALAEQLEHRLHISDGSFT